MQIQDFVFKYHKHGGHEIVFVSADLDEAATSPRYYGMLNSDGYWLIMKITVAAGISEIRFAAGSTDYAANWTARASLTSYGYITALF